MYLEAKCCAQGIINKGPAHLDHLLQLGLVPLQALGVADQRGVGVVHLKRYRYRFFSLSLRRSIFYLTPVTFLAYV